MTDPHEAEESVPRLRVGVLGAGGVGGLLTTLMLNAGQEVTVVARPETCTALSQQGLRVESVAFGNLTAPDVACVSQLSEDVDVLFLTTKAPGLDTALDRISDSLLRTALIVPLLNGVEHPELIRARQPRATVAPGAIWVESARAASGVIEHRSRFVKVDLSPDVAPDQVERCAAMLRAAGLEAHLSSSEATVLWRKLGFLAPLALLTTHHDAPAGVVRTQHRADLLDVVDEIRTVAAREQVELDPAEAVAFFDGADHEMRSSMQKDAAAGRPLELEAIGGAVVRRAQRHGVNVPVTTRYVEELLRRHAVPG